ncbi:MAG: hypothetical protein OMM_13110 [Candidatus Magnetoglobus multicellularis str. Araruama]|uniref:Ketosynthase family 3 (KS3) domain-containing protein n=1 Tax=Candidatus Magnetoglobus multicellularis str. Araruama TaxID=890399 RepID=A0A1V1NUG5_9BACT|nr:MAG: hypothetical protein OMM_13110 [Candidatus Magnetoglobus multicellularis str. Araruama]
MKKANIHPGSIGYIEAHGTGTSLGDPIEIRALMDAFEQYSTEKQYCAIGSVKSNIGHLESAAGIAALTKVILQMQHKQLVPSLHSEVLNPNITFEDSPFVVQQQLQAWTPITLSENGKEKPIHCEPASVLLVPEVPMPISFLNPLNHRKFRNI